MHEATPETLSLPSKLDRQRLQFHPFTSGGRTGCGKSGRSRRVETGSSPPRGAVARIVRAAACDVRGGRIRPCKGGGGRAGCDPRGGVAAGEGDSDRLRVPTVCVRASRERRARRGRRGVVFERGCQPARSCCRRRRGTARRRTRSRSPGRSRSGRARRDPRGGVRAGESQRRPRGCTSRWRRSARGRDARHLRRRRVAPDGDRHGHGLLLGRVVRTARHIRAGRIGRDRLELAVGQRSARRCRPGDGDRDARAVEPADAGALVAGGDGPSSAIALAGNASTRVPRRPTRPGPSRHRSRATLATATVRKPPPSVTIASNVPARAESPRSGRRCDADDRGGQEGSTPSGKPSPQEHDLDLAPCADVGAGRKRNAFRGGAPGRSRGRRRDRLLRQARPLTGSGGRRSLRPATPARFGSVVGRRRGDGSAGGASGRSVEDPARRARPLRQQAAEDHERPDYGGARRPQDRRSRIHPASPVLCQNHDRATLAVSTARSTQPRGCGRATSRDRTIVSA